MPGPHRSLNRPMLREHLRRVVFREGSRDRVGAEVELIPWAIVDGRVDFEAALAASDTLWHEWPEANERSQRGSIPWRDGSLTREPGGQWEFSGPPLDRPEETAGAMVQAVEVLRQGAATHGFDFLAVGLNPWANVETIGLRNRSARYLAMQEYFDTIGPSGRQMMRLTGSVQVAVDSLQGAVSNERWELAQRLSPVLTAAFANSAVQDGRPAESANCRAHIWLNLDPRRTGIPPKFLEDPGTEPVDQYLDFALNSPVMFVARADAPFYLPSEPTPFATWMEHGLPVGFPVLEDWETHLGTLFPDVRPRGYLEFRAMDAPGIAWLAVPILIAGHALRDARIRHELLEHLRPFHDSLDELRRRAAERALADPTLSELAGILFESVRRTLCGAAEELVAAYEERYIERGTTPGEEMRGCISPGELLDPALLIALEAEREAAADRGLAPPAQCC